MAAINEQNLADRAFKITAPVLTGATGTLATGNVFGDSISVLPGKFDLSLQGVFTGLTVTLQRSFNDGINWLNVSNYTTAQELVGEVGSACSVRVGIAAGAYTGGTVNWQIYQGA